MQQHTINGFEGRLELRYHASYQNSPVALILSPHPEDGGSINHKGVYALSRTFSDRGFNTVRFNYRGVGRSEGKFEEGDSVVSDAATILDWLQLQHPSTRTFYVAGLSFGAWVAMQLLMRRPEVTRFVAISLPANKYDFTFLAPCPVSGLILHGQDDALVPLKSIEAVVARLKTQRGIEIDYRCYEGADHFFTDKLHLLMHVVGRYIDVAETPLMQAANF